jgi:hypothetical protein
MDTNDQDNLSSEENNEKKYHPHLKVTFKVPGASPIYEEYDLDNEYYELIKKAIEILSPRQIFLPLPVRYGLLLMNRKYFTNAVLKEKVLEVEDEVLRSFTRYNKNRVLYMNLITLDSFDLGAENIEQNHREYLRGWPSYGAVLYARNLIYCKSQEQILRFETDDRDWLYKKAENIVYAEVWQDDLKVLYDHLKQIYEV